MAFVDRLRTARVTLAAPARHAGSTSLGPCTSETNSGASRNSQAQERIARPSSRSRGSLVGHPGHLHRCQEIRSGDGSVQAPELRAAHASRAQSGQTSVLILIELAHPLRFRREAPAPEEIGSAIRSEKDVGVQITSPPRLKSWNLSCGGCLAPSVGRLPCFLPTAAGRDYDLISADT